VARRRRGRRERMFEVMRAGGPEDKNGQLAGGHEDMRAGGRGVRPARLRMTGPVIPTQAAAFIPVSL